MSPPDPSSAMMGSTCSQETSGCFWHCPFCSSLHRQVLSAMITPTAPRCCALRTCHGRVVGHGSHENHNSWGLGMGRGMYTYSGRVTSWQLNERSGSIYATLRRVVYERNIPTTRHGREELVHA